MNLIRSLIGRRQFLAAAAASTSALTLKKFANVADPLFTAGMASASDLSGDIGKKPESARYTNLLSPFKIRNVIVKNRLIYTVSTPHFLQGPETFPSDAIRSYYANIAKGAAIVTCRLGGLGTISRKNLVGDTAHGAIFDQEDPAVQNYMDQMVEGIHCMGSLVSGGNLRGGPGGSAGDLSNIITQAKSLEDQGFDVVTMTVPDMQDKDRVSSTIDQMQAVKNATNLIIMTAMVVINPSVRPEISDSGQNITGVITLEDAIAIAKAFENSVDILFIKASSGMTNHPTSFNMEKGKPVSLDIAQAIKESGAKIIVAPNGGFRDPDLNEEYIAKGKTDMIAMARAFISDPDYGKKINEGRGEDTVPCIMCNKCHGLSLTGPWYSVCSVNPELGIDSAVKVIDAPAFAKNVAVIGGGPAGMKAAVTAAERGHKVTLYEKNDYLGGLLRHSDFSPFKWALRDYKDYLIREVKKAGVNVLLNTEATPELIKRKDYDAVLAAVGSETVIPKIPGSDLTNVWNVLNVYGKEKELGKNVVVIGGSEFGLETGMYIAGSGHKTTVLTSEKELMSVDRVHYEEQVIDTYEHLDNFNFILDAIVTGISGDKINYVDGKGNKASIGADSVVLYGGLRPRQDEAMKFYGSAGKGFFMAGDCTGKGGNVQKCIRSAFFAASQI